MKITIIIVAVVLLVGIISSVVFTDHLTGDSWAVAGDVLMIEKPQNLNADELHGIIEDYLEHRPAEVE